MKRIKTNKTIAGYHLLMILSAIDFKFSPEEDGVIRSYLEKEFPFYVNLDKQMEIISNLKPSEWEDHFKLYMQDFYDDSTKDERISFLGFALSLIRADDIITKEENYYFNLLYTQWFSE